MTDSHDKAIQTVEVHAIQANPGTTLHPMAAAIIAANPTPDTLRELMQLQRDFERDQARRLFTAAKVRLRRDLPAVLSKDATVDYTGKTGIRTYYKHTTLAHAMSTVTPILVDYGFSIDWRVAVEGGKVRVTAVLSHEAGHSEETTLDAPPDSKGGKEGAQAIASTITLLERYTALALLGIATADMPEPKGEPEPEDLERIDPRKNMELAGFIRGQRFLVEDAEGYVGRTADKWTAQDRLDLREWLKAQRDGKGTASPAPKADTGPAFSLDGEEYTTDDDAPKAGRRTK